MEQACIDKKQRRQEAGNEFHYPDGRGSSPSGFTFWFFDLYHKDIFKQSARETWIDGWKVEFMAMADVRTIHQTPL
jgi:hypothetical protein